MVCDYIFPVFTCNIMLNVCYLYSGSFDVVISYMYCAYLQCVAGVISRFYVEMYYKCNGIYVSVDEHAAIWLL
jgi:hypothetical protein